MTWYVQQPNLQIQDREKGIIWMSPIPTLKQPPE